MPRHSAAVYRRRRLAVVLLLLLVLGAIGGGVWLAMAQPWKSPGSGSTPAPSASEPSGTPTDAAASSAPTEAPSPDPSETPGIVACTAADVEVKAMTDATTYAVGVLPKLSIELTNKSAQDCTMDVGSSTQKLTVTSGNDVWWRSTDCQTDPSSMIVTLEAGTTVRSAEPVVWDRTRSSVDTCAEKNRPRAPGGGASYHVSVSIGGFASAGSRQIILQ